MPGTIVPVRFRDGALVTEDDPRLDEATVDRAVATRGGSGAQRLYIDGRGGRRSRPSTAYRGTLRGSNEWRGQIAFWLHIIRTPNQSAA
ncbi:hypothetical protein BURKHO8Y_520107 [Burkholderia sp. 8Y]|nr:hypothetical protein BURKHO8Y_520107 [Burkholderia sp. 8Y]